MDRSRSLTRPEGLLLNWAMLIALEQPIGETDLPLYAQEVRGLLADIDPRPDATPLGSMPGHMGAIAAAFAQGRRVRADEDRLRWWARGYFLARQRLMTEARNAG